jgi:signal transduction histidine kinase
MIVPMTMPPEHPVPMTAADGRLDDLAQIITAYNQVTEKLQKSHETLQQEVLRLRDELASTNAQLQRSKRLSALGEMAAGIAHEIRNPLAAIQLYAEMIAEDLRDSRQPTAVTHANASKVVQAVRGLDGIVCDVLSFAREIQPHLRTVHLSELFDRAIDAHQPAIDAADVKLLRRYAHQPSLAIDADAVLLHQAILNLLRNAVDAMAHCACPRVLSLDARAEDRNILLTIRDTGPGIAEADIDRIFNPFFTTRNTGTGLGLAIVHRIVDAHGGAIAVHNDGGAVFQLTLPASPRAVQMNRSEHFLGVPA